MISKKQLKRIPPEALKALEGKLNSMPRAVQRALETKLLEIGGEGTVFFWDEPFAEQLIESGRVFTEPVRMFRGEKSRCHKNAARIWEKAPTKNRIVTGYALSNGLWLQHSWALSNGTLFETTVPRERYFGIELDDIEALQFWFENLNVYRYPDDVIPPASYWKRRGPILRLIHKVAAEKRAA